MGGIDFLNPTKGKYFDLKEVNPKLSSENQYNSAGDLFVGFVGERLDDKSYVLANVAVDKLRRSSK